MATTTHELHGTLWAGDATALRTALEDLLFRGDLCVVTRDLVALDTAILQVLLSAKRTADQLDRNLQIDCPEGGALASLSGRLALGGCFCGVDEHRGSS